MLIIPHLNDCLKNYSKLYVYIDYVNIDYANIDYTKGKEGRITLLENKINLFNWEYLGDINLKLINKENRINYIQKRYFII